MKALRKMLIVCMVAVLAGSMPVVQPVSAAPSLWQQIQQQQQEKNELTQQQSQNNENLEDLKGEHNTLQGELNNLNGQLSQVSDNLASLEQQIYDKEQEIADTQASLEEAKATEAWQYECMLIRARTMYERSETGYLNAILEKGSLDEMLNAAIFFQDIADYSQMKLEEFQENRQLIEEQEALLQREKVELDNLKIAAEAEKSKVSGLISQTANKMSDYADQIEDAEQKAREYEAAIKAAEENLEKLREELAMSQAAANGAWRDISEVTFEENDRYLLANLIYCEAGGEPYEGQLAVGAVVINRVLSAKYPNTVVGVIYQRKQFSPVGSGRLELALGANKATASCYRAADEAMSGVTNVGNCVYFRTPIDGLTGINIGGHVFY